MKTIQTIVFDWSGVISDDRRPVYEANMRIMEAYGLTRMTFDEWLPQTTQTVMEFMENQGVTEDRNTIYDLYGKLYGEIRNEGIHPVVYQDAYKALTTLRKKGKKLLVLSSHPEENVRQEAKEYNIAHLFEEFIGSTKDKVKGLILLASKLDKHPQSLLYIGDTIYDIRSARSAGYMSGGISTGYHLKDRLAGEKPDILVDQLSELSMLF